ncbi:hypothetical protein AA0Z99_05255 [Agrococcus sp. 1P02AA]|uniref:hypothetical protein n=1 Tax=Agrococcus sp. 1P02AA TaxID=3132259 RepID=UPI0039A52EEC
MRHLHLLARLAAVAAVVLALVATVSAIPLLGATPSASLVAELWRVVGLATWTALFALLTARPGLVALWMIAALSKLSLAAAGLVLGDVPGAADLVVWDGILAVILATGSVASIMARAHERQQDGDAPPRA